MKPYSILALFLLFALTAFTQDSAQSAAKISTRPVIAYLTPRTYNHPMNAMRVTPLLTEKVYDTRIQDVYRLKQDGMPCVVADSSVAYRLHIIKPKRN